MTGIDKKAERILGQARFTESRLGDALEDLHRYRCSPENSFTRLTIAIVRLRIRILRKRYDRLNAHILAQEGSKAAP
jgi:hypothetical protein